MSDDQSNDAPCAASLHPLDWQPSQLTDTTYCYLDHRSLQHRLPGHD